MCSTTTKKTKKQEYICTLYILLLNITNNFDKNFFLVKGKGVLLLFLPNILYHIFIAIALLTVVFGTCLKLWKLSLCNKNLFKIFICVGIFSKKGIDVSRKNFLSQEWLVEESYLTFHWIAFLMLLWLAYNIHWHFNDLILALSVYFKICLLFLKIFFLLFWGVWIIRLAAPGPRPSKKF